jgi:hypothetical protein
LGRRPLAQRLAVAGAGLAGLAGLALVAGYPLSMVATGADESNMFPTNATIAALAVFQLGLLVLVTPAAERLLRRPTVWKPVVAVNVVALTIFLWHMTAYLVVLWAYEGLGGTLLAEPTAGWWAQRWLWLLAPSAVLPCSSPRSPASSWPPAGPGGRQPAELGAHAHLSVEPLGRAGAPAATTEHDGAWRVDSADARDEHCGAPRSGRWVVRISRELAARRHTPTAAGTTRKGFT